IEGEGALFWFRRAQRVAPGTRVSVALKIPSSTILRKDQTADPKQIPKPSLFQTVADLAPHIEFPIFVEENGLTKRFTGTWHLPETWRSREPCISEVDLNLTVDAPLGLDGIAKVFMVEENGSFKDSAYVEEPSLDDEADGDDLCDYVELKSGYIEHIHKD